MKSAENVMKEALFSNINDKSRNEQKWINADLSENDYHSVAYCNESEKFKGRRELLVELNERFKPFLTSCIPDL